MTVASEADMRQVQLSDFSLIAPIGEGNYSSVVLARHIATGGLYAIKCLSKDQLIEAEEVTHTLAERNILVNARHPFLVPLHAAIQTPANLYFVLSFCPGGELFNHLRARRTFDEPTVRVIAAELTLALEYLHANGVIYRDLKPENILVQSDGHVALADFGLSKAVGGEDVTTSTFCGTPEYLAPEMLTARAHTMAVDWWALGTLIFELLAGAPPFFSPHIPAMYAQIVSAPLRFPAHVSPTAADLIAKLLCRDPSRRLGCASRPPAKGAGLAGAARPPACAHAASASAPSPHRDPYAAGAASPSRGSSTGRRPRGAEAVKAHPFFADIDWRSLHRKDAAPPFPPPPPSALGALVRSGAARPLRRDFAADFNRPAGSGGAGGSATAPPPSHHRAFRRFSFDHGTIARGELV